MNAKYLEMLKNCSLCPHECNVNRIESNSGWCKTDAGIYISSICIHRGEEPVISGDKGICNVFFAHCNLQCVYCQNYQISNNKLSLNIFKISLDETVRQITNILSQGINILGFVSPSHFVPQMLGIIESVKQQGYNPTIVYNSNGYDKVDTLKMLENIVDVYLPDFKYFDNEIAKKYSGIKNYAEIAKSALKEMYRQKGSTLIINENGYAESGILIRHLVLPNNVENSINVLKFISEEISSNLHISLMSQYFPVNQTNKHSEISRKLKPSEYKQVVEVMEEFELYNGYIQDLESYENYLPDFNNEHPFEK